MFKLPIILSLIFSVQIYSQIKFDTLSVRQVGTGVHHLTIEEKSLPWTLDVLKIELKGHQLKIESVKANDRKSSWERTSSMADKKNYDSHYVVGAINGDFYDGNGTPVGMQVINGEVITPSNHWSAIGFDYENNPFIEVTSLSGKVFTKNSSNNINGYNGPRATNNLILYNSYFGSSTTTNQFGCEVTIEPVIDWLVNDSVKCVVTSKITDQGNSSLSSGIAVLSGHGNSKTFLEDNVNVGDTITILNTINPGLPKLTQLINGFPKIIRDGENCALDCYAEEGGSTTFATDRHPRTAAGISQDSTYLYLVTVDGRQTISKGMSLPELADFMIGLGVYRAVNLDGGGSTTMVVRSDIVNSPSDPGGERSVSNALMIVSKAEAGPFAQVKLNSEFAKVYRHENYQFTTAGYDEHLNKTYQLEESAIVYSLSHEFGTITSTGLFTAGSTIDTGYVYTDYNEYRDSALVVVNSIKNIILSPAAAVTDTSRLISFKVQSFDLDGVDKKLSYEEFNWISTNTFAGIVDSSGVFTGLNSGTTEVIVSWENVSDTSLVTVEIEEGVQVLNSFDNLNDWRLTGEGIDTAASSISITEEASSEGNTSLKLDYQFIYGAGLLSWAYLNCDINVSGVPANLGVDTQVDGEEHTIAFVVENNEGDQFALLGHKKAHSIFEFTPIWANFDNPIPLSENAKFHFPVAIKQIALILGSDREVGVTYKGTIHFDNLRAVYPDAVTNVDEEKFVPTDFVLYQNYPNPFNPITTIKYSIPVNSRQYAVGSRKTTDDRIQNSENRTQNQTFSNQNLASSIQYQVSVSLKVYDVLGREVAVLVNENQLPGNYSVTFNASGLSSGIYFYRLTAGSQAIVKKLTLLK